MCKSRVLCVRLVCVWEISPMNGPNVLRQRQEIPEYKIIAMAQMTRITSSVTGCVPFPTLASKGLRTHVIVNTYYLSGRSNAPDLQGLNARQ